MFQRTDAGRKRFLLGKNAPEKAAEAARSCGGFRPDDEEEWVSEEPVSCYNCRYRRWTENSFDCMKGSR